jgi:hypothetical protein
VQIVLERLVRACPFHADLIAQGVVEEDFAVDTVGATIRRAAVHLLYAPAFVCHCTLDQLRVVLDHEVKDLLLGHLTAAPAQYPDWFAPLIAEEETVHAVCPIGAAPTALCAVGQKNRPSGTKNGPPGTENSPKYAKTEPKPRKSGAASSPRTPTTSGRKPAPQDRRAR